MPVTSHNNMKFVGGALCLDFVNTVGGREGRSLRGRQRDYQDAVTKDKIGSYRDLLIWSELANVTNRSGSQRLARRAERHADEAANVFHRAIELRESLYRILKSLLEKWPVKSQDLAVFE